MNKLQVYTEAVLNLHMKAYFSNLSNLCEINHNRMSLLEDSRKPKESHHFTAIVLHDIWML